MTEPDEHESDKADDAAGRERRRRRRAEIFGDVLPESTSDDADEATSEDRSSDEWLRRQVPPHHE